MKILQICPVDHNVTIAFYDAEARDLVNLSRPSCLALVARGEKTEVVYMELVDNEVVPVDTTSKDFLGFVGIDDTDELNRLRKQANKRYNEEKNGKPK